MLKELVRQDCLITGFKASSKKQVLQALATHISKCVNLDSRDIFKALIDREKLGSTGFGDGVAIPHARLAGVSEITGLFARLEKPVEFDSIDGRPVDLVFVLLAPEDAGAAHLQALSRISRLFRRADVLSKLRTLESCDELKALIDPNSETIAA